MRALVTQGWTLVTARKTADNALCPDDPNGPEETRGDMPRASCSGLSYHESFGPSWILKEQEERQHPSQRHAGRTTDTRPTVGHRWWCLAEDVAGYAVGADVNTNQTEEGSLVEVHR